MLIRTRKHSRFDLARWESLELQDEAWALVDRYRRHVASAEAAVAKFAQQNCYVGVSWGKDSVVVADLVARVAPTVPMVWVRVEPISNPECALVRDAFAAVHPAARLDEIVIHARRDKSGWHASGTLERGFAEAAHRYGDRYISGIRGEESGARKMRMMRYGAETARSCAAIGWWTHEDVFAYLHERALPVHPAYAYSYDGLLERGRIRVASLGGERGTGWGRRQWEERYYWETLARLEQDGQGS